MALGFVTRVKSVFARLGKYANLHHDVSRGIQIHAENLFGFGRRNHGRANGGEGHTFVGRIVPGNGAGTDAG
jgi:hypothetical protein